MVPVKMHWRTQHRLEAAGFLAAVCQRGCFVNTMTQTMKRAVAINRASHLAFFFRLICQLEAGSVRFDRLIKKSSFPP